MTLAVSQFIKVMGLLSNGVQFHGVYRQSRTSGGVEEYQAPKKGLEALFSAEGLRAKSELEKTPGKESRKQTTESEGMVPFSMSNVPFNVPKSSESQGGASPCCPLCGLENPLTSLGLCFLSPTCELGRMVPANSNISKGCELPVAVLSASFSSIPAAQQQRGQTELGFCFPIHRDERKQKPGVAIYPEQQVFWEQGIPAPGSVYACPAGNAARKWADISTSSHCFSC